MPQMAQIDSLRMPRGKKPQTVSRSRHNRGINVPFALTIILVIAYGLLISFTATYNDADYNFSRQVGGAVIGAVLMVLLWRFDYHQLSGYVTVFMIINIVLILMPHIPLIGVESNGALSWVRIGPISFQPGEFAKITVILMDASVVARYRGRLNNLHDYLKALAIMCVPFICILTQPDLGTGMVYLFIAFIALLVGGAAPRYLIGTVGILFGLVVLIFVTDPLLDSLAGSDVGLKDYQRARLLVFLDSSYDPTGDGYNLQQAKIAIGSGGLFGKGFMNATQSTLGYLPESATDFVFCVLAEQFGFVGALILLALYLSLLLNSMRIARGSGDLFGMIMVMCVVGMWCFQILENIGMDCGLMPITGIPLPFVSYGSSFMIVNFVLLGLVGSVWAHNGR